MIETILDISWSSVNYTIHMAKVRFRALRGQIVLREERNHMKHLQIITNSTIALAVLVALTNSGIAAEEKTSAFPGTEAGAKSLLQEFLKPGADLPALSKQLRPTAADYAAVFDADLSAKMESTYGPAWDGGKIVIAPKPGQSELKLFSATSDEMKSWTGSAHDFAGGWKQVAPKLKPGVTIYRFKFVEPGKDLGMAFDGLIYVNGNWRIFPKPWRAMATK